MYQQVEEKLHNLLEATAPDLLSAIESAPYEKITSEEELFRELMRRPSHISAVLKLVSVAAILLLMLSPLLRRQLQLNGTLRIEAGNSVELSISRKNKIVKVNENHSDRHVLVNPNLEGMDLEEGLTSIYENIDQASQGEGKKVQLKYHSIHKNADTKDIIIKITEDYMEHSDLNVEATYQSAGNPADCPESPDVINPVELAANEINPFEFTAEEENLSNTDSSEEDLIDPLSEEEAQQLNVIVDIAIVESEDQEIIYHEESAPCDAEEYCDTAEYTEETDDCNDVVNVVEN